MKPITYISSIALGLAACSNGSAAKAPAPEHKPAPASAFCADSAYAFVKQQCEFGPRVPGSKASEMCAQWLIDKLNEFGAQNVHSQRASLNAYNGDKLDIQNITAQFAPEADNRVLLLAHWDSRPWADHDPDPAMRSLPIDGANDGASGTAVILEIARQLSTVAPNAGVDILLVDAEDYGRKAGEETPDDNSWALGTQYWLDHPTLDLDKVSYAVLLDMVGGNDAVFPREMHSQFAASNIVDRVWAAARRAGYKDRFPDRMGGAVIDDHVYLLQRGIPAIDIIECANPATGSFPPTWHTHADNADNIDPASLAAVGATLLELLRH